MNQKIRCSHFLFTLFTLALLAMMLVSCTSDNAILYVLRGNNQRGLGKIEQAIPEYDRAIALDPSLAEANYNRGRAYDMLGDYEKAIADFDRAIALKQDWAEAYRARGRAYRESGNAERSLEDYDNALALNLDFADAYIGRGLTYATLGQLERAIQDYDKGIELSPDDVYAYYERGVAYYNLGNLARAIQDLDKAIELNPDFAATYVWRGNAHDDSGHFDQAVADYGRALELAPDDAYAYYNRGYAYLRRGYDEGDTSDLEQAIADITKALELVPDEAYAYYYYYRGLAYAGLGDNEQAIQDFELYLELAPDASDRAEVEAMLEELEAELYVDTPLLVDQAQSYASQRLANYRLKEPEAELADLEAYLALNPWDTQMFRYLHERRQSVAAYRAVLGQFEESLPPAPTAAEAEYARGMVLLLRGRYLGYADDVAAAADAFTAAIAADPTLAVAYHKRGLAYLAAVTTPEYGVTGMHIEGESGSVTRVDPVTNETFTQTIESYQQELNAFALEQSQAAAKAIDDFQRALELDPALVEAVHDLGVVYYVYGLGEPTPIEDAMGVAGALFGTAEPDEATRRGRAASFPLLNQAAELAPDWPLARYSRALANLLFGIERASGGMTALYAAVEDVDYSPNDERIAAAYSDGRVRIWDAQSGTLYLNFVLQNEEEYGPRQRIDFSPDGQRLATAGDDGTVRIWDAESGQELLVLRGHEDSVTDVAFSPDGASLASSSEDNTVRLWAVESGKERWVVDGQGPIAFSPDGAFLAADSGGDGLALWDVETGEQRGSLESGDTPAQTLLYSADGRYLAMVAVGGKLAVWNVQTEEMFEPLSKAVADMDVSTFVFGPDGRTGLVVAADSSLHILDVQTGEERQVLEVQKEGVNDIAISANGKRIAVAGADATVVVWDFAAGEPALQLAVAIDQDEAVAEALAALETALQDTDYLIAQGAEDGWPYYIRILAKVMTAELIGEEADSAQIEADSREFLLRSPNVNYDFRLQQAATQMRLSLTAAPLLPFLSGRLELDDDAPLYIQEGLGLRIELPNQAPNHTLADVSIPSAHYLRIHDDFRIIDLVVVDATLGEQSLEEWLAATFLPLYPDANVLPEPLETSHGSALLVEMGATHLAFLAAGEQIYTFAYRPGVEANSGFAGTYGITVGSGSTVLKEMIERVTFAQE